MSTVVVESDNAQQETPVAGEAQAAVEVAETIVEAAQQLAEQQRDVERESEHDALESVHRKIDELRESIGEHFRELNGRLDQLFDWIALIDAQTAPARPEDEPEETPEQSAVAPAVTVEGDNNAEIEVVAEAENSSPQKRTKKTRSWL